MTTFNGSGRRASPFWLAALAAVSLVLGPGTARADDAAIQRKIEGRLARAGVEATADVGVTVVDGAVTLDGVVTRMDVALAAERAARRESKSVANRLKVVPEIERKDSEIREDVVDEILRYSWYTVFDSIEARVQDGVVILGGSVNQPYRKTDIENRVARVAGVKGLKSDISVQGVSVFDDRLRHELVRRIYGNDPFVRYSVWAQPPIRIIVDRGRVTLTGFVASPVEQQLLGNIARGTPAFGVDNQVGLESDRAAEPAVPASVQS